MSTSVPVLPTKAENTPKQVLGDAPDLRIAFNKSRHGGGRRGAGCEGKITQLIEEKISF